jgi:hypothetical protein
MPLIKRGRAAAAARLACALALCLLAGPAWAARVLRVEAPRPDGRFVEVDESGEARRLRDGQRLSLRVGDEVAVGDRLEVDRARVVVEASPGELVTLGEGARVVWGERSLLDEAGALYLRVRSGFAVGFGSGEATVEGTRFSVRHGPEGVVVAVDEGRVRVRAAGGEVVVTRGDQSVVSPGAAPAPPASAARVALTDDDLRDTAGRSARLGLGLAAGGRVIDGLQGGQTAAGRLMGWGHLPGPLLAGAELGAVVGDGRWHLEPAATAGLDLGRLAVLGEAGVALGAWGRSGADAPAVVVPQLGARARLLLPRDSALRGLVELRVAAGGRPSLGLPVGATAELAVGGAWLR